MNIREIQIDEFRRWSHLSISELAPTLNVIHVHEAAEVSSIPHFIRSILYGSVGGSSDAANGVLSVEDREGRFIVRRSPATEDADSETLRVQRESDSVELSHDVLARLVAGIPEEVAMALFLDEGTESTPDQQLARWHQLGLTDTLLPARRSQDTLPLDTARHQIARLADDCSNDGLAPLIALREKLLDEIREKLHATRRNAFDIEGKRHSPDAVAADLQDEIAELTRRQEPLAAALALREEWQRLIELRQRTEATRDSPDDLDKHLEKLGELDRERQQAEKRLRRCQRLLDKVTKIDSKPGIEIENRLRQLLDQRDWLQASHPRNVLPATREGNSHTHLGASRPSDHTLKASARAELSVVAATIRPLAAGRREARQQIQRIGHRLAILEEQRHQHAAGEIGFRRTPGDGNDDRLRQLELLDLRLADLDQRFHDVRRECQRWLGNQVLPMPMTIALAVLFGASVACLGGGLMFAESAAQLALVLIGFGGMVTAGILKAMFVRVAGQHLVARRREQLRLSDEIERIHMERADFAARNNEQVAASNGQLVRAVPNLEVVFTEVDRLQRQRAEAEDRLREIDGVYERALARYHLEPSLTPARAMRALRRRLLAEMPVDTLPSVVDTHRARQSAGELKRIVEWRRTARRLLKQADFEETPSRDVDELLDQLDACFQQQRQAAREYEDVRRRRTGLRRRVASRRRSLCRATDQHRAALAQAGVSDVVELQQRREQVLEVEATAREAGRLQREIDQILEGHVRGHEIRRMLERLSADEIKEQYQKSKSSLAELDSQLKLRASTKRETNLDQSGTRAVAQLRLTLETTEERIRRTIRRRRIAGLALRGIADLSPRTVTHAVVEGASRYLQALSEGVYQSMGMEPTGRWYLEDARHRRILWHETAALADKQQTALALRLAIVDSMASTGRKLPLVMASGVTSQIRPSVAASVLRQFATNCQVLLVTHDTEMAETYTSHGVPVVSVYRAAKYASQPPPSGTRDSYEQQKIERQQDRVKAIEYTRLPVSQPRPEDELTHPPQVPSMSRNQDDDGGCGSSRERDAIPVEYHTIRHVPMIRTSRLDEMPNSQIASERNGSTSNGTSNNGHQTHRETVAPVTTTSASDDPGDASATDNENGKDSNASDLPDWWPD